MRKVWRAWQSDAGGQAMVEAAILIPMLLFLMAGIFTIGLWLNATLTTSAAAREGARAAALTGDCASLIAGIKKTMDVVDTDHDGERVRAIVDPDPLPGTGQDVTVVVQYDLPTIFSYFKTEYAKTNNTYPFSRATGRATARMEVDPIDKNVRCVH